VLLKALKNNEEVFLLRWSEAWDSNGFFWFTGGIQDSLESSTDCAKRELKEEINLDPFAIKTLTKFACAYDKRISERLHVVTSYTYSIFCVSIDEQNTSISPILHSEFSVPKFRGGHQLNQKCKWFTWDEIKQSQELNRHAAGIIEVIDTYGIAKIGLSVQNPIVENLNNP
jgi:ADP-ribose pyrophosphatase YjhB (NUDIX family)